MYWFASHAVPICGRGRVGTHARSSPQRQGLVLLQLESTFIPVACTRLVSGDWLFVPSSRRSDGRERVRRGRAYQGHSHAVAKRALVPVLARSGEMAPFQTKSELLVTDPTARGNRRPGRSRTNVPRCRRPRRRHGPSRGRFGRHRPDRSSNSSLEASIRVCRAGTGCPAPAHLQASHRSELRLVGPVKLGMGVPFASVPLVVTV